jgi:hypothetical protein
MPRRPAGISRSLKRVTREAAPFLGLAGQSQRSRRLFAKGERRGGLDVAVAARDQFARLRGRNWRCAKQRPGPLPARRAGPASFACDPGRMPPILREGPGVQRCCGGGKSSHRGTPTGRKCRSGLTPASRLIIGGRPYDRPPRGKQPHRVVPISRPPQEHRSSQRRSDSGSDHWLNPRGSARGHSSN